MKNKDIKKLKLLLKILQKDKLQFIFGLGFIIFVLVKYKEVEFISLIDFSIIISFILVYILTMIISISSKTLTNRLEDHIKLDRDYDKLMRRYPLDKFVVYKNKSNKNKLFRKRVETTEIDEYTYKFAIIIENEIKTKNIRIIDDKSKKYIQPEFIKEHFKKLMSAHSTSDIYNQMNIRLDKIEETNNNINLYTSRTMYFDSLVTNRAMDFELGNKLSIREILNPGPYVEPLESSVLSNHLGFNIYIKTNDNKIIFVNRNMNVSIGKGTLGSSVGASLKIRYCVDEKYNFNTHGIKKAVMEEMKDELGINEDCYEFSLNKNLIAIYRDLIEGGKPQFLFYIEIDKSEIEVKNLFEINLKKENKKYDTIVDGDRLIFLDLNKDFYLSPDLIFIENKKYFVLPSVSGTLAYLLEYIKNK